MSGTLGEGQEVNEVKERKDHFFPPPRDQNSCYVDNVLVALLYYPPSNLESLRPNSTEPQQKQQKQERVVHLLQQWHRWLHAGTPTGNPELWHRLRRVLTHNLQKSGFPNETGGRVQDDATAFLTRLLEAAGWLTATTTFARPVQQPVSQAGPDSESGADQGHVSCRPLRTEVLRDRPAVWSLTPYNAQHTDFVTLRGGSEDDDTTNTASSAAPNWRWTYTSESDQTTQTLSSPHRWFWLSAPPGLILDTLQRHNHMTEEGWVIRSVVCYQSHGPNGTSGHYVSAVRLPQFARRWLVYDSLNAHHPEVRLHDGNLPTELARDAVLCLFVQTRPHPVVL